MILLLALVCASWNLKFFPSARAEHRASPRVERANVFDAADVLSAAFTNRSAIVLALQEVRDAQCCSNLILASSLPLRLAAISSFREYDRRRSWQQTAILSDLPVLTAGFREYAHTSTRPPRGFSYALLQSPSGPILVFSVHLKSNYRATSPLAPIAKRTEAISQVLAFAATNFPSHPPAKDPPRRRLQRRFLHQPRTPLLPPRHQSLHLVLHLPAPHPPRHRPLARHHPRLRLRPRPPPHRPPSPRPPHPPHRPPPPPHRMEVARQ